MKKIIVNEEILKKLLFEMVKDRHLIKEIATQDAYEKFYKGKVPEEVYQKLMQGAPQMTVLHKIALNHLAANTVFKEHPMITPNYVDLIPRFWNSASEESKQYVLRICKSNEKDYTENVRLFSDDLEKMVKMKTHTENSYVDRGIEVLFKTDNGLTVTCTKSYASSCRHFNYTRWCTASDQFGEYDGFQQFQNYTNFGILVQFVDGEWGYQVQYKCDYDGTQIIGVGSICDIEDKTAEITDVATFVNIHGVDYDEIYKNCIEKNAGRLIAETREISNDETFYFGKRKAERILTCYKRFENGVKSEKADEVAKEAFERRDERGFYSKDQSYYAYRNKNFANDEVVQKNFIPITVAFYGTTSEDERFWDSYCDDDEFYICEVGRPLINTMVYIFDNSGNIVNKYYGICSVFQGRTLVITDKYDEELGYGVKIFAVIDILENKVLFNHPRCILGIDETSEYLFSTLNYEEQQHIYTEDFLIVSPKKGTAIALNCETAEAKQLRYNESYFEGYYD